MNLKVVAYLAFTHHESKGKSIRQLADEIGMNPGGFYRLLRQLGLVHPKEKKRKHRFLAHLTDVPTDCPHCGCSLIDDKSPGADDKRSLSATSKHRFHDTPHENKKNEETETPETRKPSKFAIIRHFQEMLKVPDIIAGEDEDNHSD